MSMVSFRFWVFVIIVIVAFFAVPRKRQWQIILISNVVFYAMSGIKYLIYVLATALITYWMAFKLSDISIVGNKLLTEAESAETKKEIRTGILSIKKTICAIAIMLTGGVWVFLKYTNFLILTYNRIIGLVSTELCVAEMGGWILPLGISFYTFHEIGYLVDVYRGKYLPERNFAKYFAFVTYFPHIIQGPFSRYDMLGKSIFEEHEFSYDRLCEGCSRILWGLFKKLVIADKLGITVTEIFTNYMNYSGVHILFAMVAYCIQLYADFSGYMDIACGISNISGIELAENFRQPYFARSVDEFWRRWHITLGKWFKDYVFYPVSMGRAGQKLGRWAREKWGAKMGKLVPGYFALVFVWTATGLWHGANWTYLVWGYLNLLVIISTMQLSDFYKKVKRKLHIKSESIIWEIFCIARTFCLVCFFRFFSATTSLQSAVSMLKHIVTDLDIRMIKTPGALFVKMNIRDVYIVLTGVGMMLFVDIFAECEKWEWLKARCPFVIRNLIYAFLIVAMILFAGGSTDLTGGFMYANF